MANPVANVRNGRNTQSGGAEMRRTITWKDSFWISSGASTLVLFSIGSIAATVGTPSWIIWGASALMGFVQLFIYAEIAGMFPNKSGGASVYGSVAWVRYSKLFAPINVWAYWLAWSPVLAIGASLAGSYIVTAFFGNTPFGKFSLTLLDLSAILPGIKLSLSGSVLIGILVLLLSFYIQHTGILKAARTQFALALLSLIPIGLLSIIPLVTGKVNFSNFTPLVPQGETSWWTPGSFTLIMGGMFIAAWTTYAAETAVCYTSEFKDPSKDNVRAITSSGILAFVCFTLLPFTFLGVLGMKSLSDPAFVAGDPQAAIVKLATMTFGEGSGHIITLMLIFALILSISTAMAGGSRTLYQGSLDGLLPKFLGSLNHNGVPTKAMAADLIFNIFLLMLGSPILVLAASSVAYVLCIAMDMNAGWMHRLQRPEHYRPYRAPDWLIFIGGPILSLINLAFIFFGANVFAPNALWYGLGAISLVIPIFFYRHYVVDKGLWPQAAQRDLGIERPLP
jgi:amino acid transporter